MQRRNTPRDGMSDFAHRINKLEKQFEALDTPHTIKGERPPAYIWIPGGGVLVLLL